ncbi:hypothetical protein DFH28DRAFT_1128330 [Melampsora americana]|nr:hypothetical protein DFH28DRAFT_1128330 [Melampsora americana]
MLVIRLFCGLLVATVSSILAIPFEEPLVAMSQVEDIVKSGQVLDKGKGRLMDFKEGEIDHLYPQREKLPKDEGNPKKNDQDPLPMVDKPSPTVFADIPDSQLTHEEQRIKYGQSWGLGGKATRWVWDHIFKPPIESVKKVWKFLTTPIVKGEKAHTEEVLQVLKKYGIDAKTEPVGFDLKDPATWLHSQRPQKITLDPKDLPDPETPKGEKSSRPPLGYPI